MRSGLVAFVAVALALGACGRTHAPEVPVAPVFEGIDLARTRCSRRELLLPVAIDGTLGWFVIDSGSFTNVVYEPFASRAKLALENNLDRIGGGVGIRVLRVHARSFAVPGLAISRPPDLVMLDRAASPLARPDCHDVAGVVSPAQLVPPGSALLVDFAAAKLTRVPADRIDAYLSRVEGQRFVATKRDGEYTPGIDVSFGDRRLRMMIDTGACCTWVTTSSRVGKAHLEHSSPDGTVNRLLGTTDSRAVRSRLQFGEVERTLDLKLLEPDAGDARETGAIGADALTSCVVAIRPREIRGVCR